MSWLVEVWDLIKMSIILWTKNSRLNHSRKKENAIEAPFTRGYKEKCKITFPKLPSNAPKEMRAVRTTMYRTVTHICDRLLYEWSLTARPFTLPQPRPITINLLTNHTLMSWVSRKVGSCEQCHLYWKIVPFIALSFCSSHWRLSSIQWWFQSTPHPAYHPLQYTFVLRWWHTAALQWATLHVVLGYC